jgi:hypothetical protein
VFRRRNTQPNWAVLWIAGITPRFGIDAISDRRKKLSFRIKAITLKH